MSRDLLYYFDRIEEKPIEKIRLGSLSYIKKYLLVPPSKLRKTLIGSDIVNLELNVGVIVGYMGSGKTTLALTLAKIIEDYYTSYNMSVKTILSIDFPSAINAVEEGDEVIVIIIDDAPTKYIAGGRQRTDKEFLKPLYLIRHLLVRKSGWEAILGILFFNTQRYMSLDINFRNAPLKIFKTLLFDPREFGDAAMLFKSDYLRALKYLTLKILIDKDNDYKSFFVYRLGDRQGVVRIPFTGMPRNLINLRSKREEELRSAMEEDSILEPSKVIYTIAYYMGKAGISWNKTREHLSKYREVGIRYSDHRAYEYWRMGSNA